MNDYKDVDYIPLKSSFISGSPGATEQTVAYYPFVAVIADLGTPTTGQPCKFGGKELLTTNGLNEYDFGAMNYYSAVPGFTKPDPLCEKYPWISPYLYCINNPVNAFDPDGNLVIFLNGMHKGDGGEPKYWNGLDQIISSHLKDERVIYVDGSWGGVVNTLTSGIVNSNLSAKNRFYNGYILGDVEAKSIYENLMDHETIKIITHSMGAASAKGFISALLDYAQKQGMDPRILFELDLAPFEWWDQKGITSVPTFTISHWFDGVAWPAFMKNATNNRTHIFTKPKDILSEHGVDSFKDEIEDTLDGIIKRMNSGEIEVYIEGERIN